MSKVAVLDCVRYDKEEIRSRIVEGFKFIGMPDIKGKSVLLKPNLLMPAEPEYAVTTHPILVETVGEVLSDFGAKEILIGDSPGNALSNIENLYKRTGMESVARRTGFTLINFSQEGVIEIENEGGVVPVLPITKAVKRADYIVNLPKLKTHNFTLITCAIKNMFGCIPGFNKSKMHASAPSPKEFSRLIVEIFEKVRPNLTIVDAIEGMEGDGPSGGVPRRFNKVLMSYDAVSIDAIGGWMLGYKPEEILTTRIAQERGIGIAELKKIEISGGDLDELFGNDIKKVKTVYNIVGRVPSPLLGFLSKRLVKLIKIFPEIDDKKCIRCKICLNSCPENAISEIDGRMKIDYKKCISCYCCHELCPQHAISIRKNKVADKLWLARDSS
jgi:uncharacterized protein (DUF362 family)/Pyruvate/2-oxoacid:ferredoxin oxidoreductase delta subunit